MIATANHRVRPARELIVLVDAPVSHRAVDSPGGGPNDLALRAYTLLRYIFQYIDVR